MQAALFRLALVCAVCGGAAVLSATITVASVTAVQVVGLGFSYLVDLPQLLSCGHPARIQPEDVGCVGVYTDSSIFVSNFWIENQVLDMVHSMVGYGTTFNSACGRCRMPALRD